MAIKSGNIKFKASQVMDDVPEGGGRATSKTIVDGASNEVFPDISEADRAGGRVRMRKLFMTVDTSDTDTLLGSNVIVGKPPVDPNVSVTLFTTGDYFDRRDDARNRVEAYLFAAADWAGFLLENHISGQRNIQIFQRPGAAAPEPGETLVLIQAEGLPAEKKQYVRVSRVSTEIRTFTFQMGTSSVTDYDAQVVTCDLSDSLRYDFLGSPPSRTFTRASDGTRIRTTVVADAARYYGASLLAEKASIGSFSVRAETMFSRLVPSSQTEIPLVDRVLAGDTQPLAQSGSSRSYSGSLKINPGASVSLPTGCWPGTLNIGFAGGAITDDSLGSVIRNGAVIGSIAYATGQIVFGSNGPSGSGTLSITYTPAASADLPCYSTLRPVTASNRSYVWVVPLSPQPSPGSIEVAYQSQGRWYVLRDNGVGVISGSDPGHGSGNVNYGTGTTNVTLGALPDAGSSVVYSWGTPQEFLPLPSPDLAITPPKIELQLDSKFCAPGSLKISWNISGSKVTATDDGAGNIVGAATGQVAYGTGRVWFRPKSIPLPGEQYEIEYSGSDYMQDHILGDAFAGGTSFTATLPDAPIRPGTVSIVFQLKQEITDSNKRGFAVTTEETVPASVHDDGQGNLILEASSGPVLLHGSSINYTTGHLVLSVNIQVYKPVKQYELVPPFASA